MEDYKVWYETVGAILTGAGTVLALLTVPWAILRHVYSERLHTAEKREEDYKKKTDSIPELEKTISELQEKLAKYDRKEKFKFSRNGGVYIFEQRAYCPVCLVVQGIEMHLVDIPEEYRQYCPNCNKYFPPK